QQARGELVRIVKNDHVIDGQAKRRRDRHGRSQRTLHRRWLHPADLLTVYGMTVTSTTGQLAVVSRSRWWLRADNASRSPSHPLDVSNQPSVPQTVLGRLAPHPSL